MMEPQILWDDPTQLTNLRLGIQAIGVVNENRKALLPAVHNWMKHPRRNRLRLGIIQNTV